MTIYYGNQLQNGNDFRVLFRLMSLWQGSIYKEIGLDILFYLFLYYIINFIYRFGLGEVQKGYFDKLIESTADIKQKIPFFFLLGIFNVMVIIRWIRLFRCIPIINRQAFMFEGYIHGNNEERCRQLRMILLRYVNLSWILLMRTISKRIYNRFTSSDIPKHQKQGLREIFECCNRDEKIRKTYGKIITESEIKTFEAIAAKCAPHCKSRYEPEFWIPLQWASRILQKTTCNNYFTEPTVAFDMMGELIRLLCIMRKLEVYAGIMTPLVVTQGVIIAVYSYFLCDLFASQMPQSGHNRTVTQTDMYFPVFSIFQFIFIMGWLRVAVILLDPFGADEEDFETSDILNANLDATYQTIESEGNRFPEHLESGQMPFAIKSDIECNDKLETFLDHISDELELKQSEENIASTEISGLEMEKPFCEKFISYIQRLKPRKRIKQPELSPFDQDLRSLTSSRNVLSKGSTSSIKVLDEEEIRFTFNDNIRSTMK